MTVFRTVSLAFMGIRESKGVRVPVLLTTIHTALQHRCEDLVVSFYRLIDLGVACIVEHINSLEQLRYDMEEF